MAEPYDLDLLSSAFHLSTRTMLRKFKDETGEYPTPWDVADFAAAAHSVYQAVQNPSASNIGWAAADVGAAALPIVPSTKGVRVAAKYGDEAIQSLKAAGKAVLEPAQQSRYTGLINNAAKGGTSALNKLVSLKKGAQGKYLMGGEATAIAENLAESFKGSKAVKSIENIVDKSGIKAFKVEMNSGNVIKINAYKNPSSTSGSAIQIYRNGETISKYRVPYWE